MNDALPSAYVTLGRIHDALGKNDLALTEFQRALQLDSRNADALTGMKLILTSMPVVPPMPKLPTRKPSRCAPTIGTATTAWACSMTTREGMTIPSANCSTSSN